MNLHHQIERLINFGLQQQLIKDSDIIYIRNQYLELFNLNYIENVNLTTEQLQYPDNILNSIYELLTKECPALLNYLGKTKDSISNRIMNVLIDKPSSVINNFMQHVNTHGISLALDHFYQKSIASYYIKMQDVTKNKHWQITTNYGIMEVTINLSKPEKDPKAIAMAKQQQDNNIKYPKCLLCIENEGFSGNYNHPARQNHRLLPLTLNNQTWFFQFSPYVYYHQHAIIINPNHSDMQIDSNTFNAFFDFVDLIPEYIIGSNSDIPIVGGSILTHDHYQAGKYVFPVEKAQVQFKFELPSYPKVELVILNWPITTLRLIGKRQDLQQLAELTLAKWKSYTNPDLDIIAYSNQEIRHNAITPILRKLNQDQYCLYLMLRNNCTSTKYPDGIFHPHSNLHHIKKENIGLIEAMGLAILPGRLEQEILLIKTLLLHNQSKIKNLSSDSPIYKHKAWIEYLYNKYKAFSNTQINKIIDNEIGHVFELVLEDCGVFKNNEDGEQGLRQFLESLIA